MKDNVLIGICLFLFFFILGATYLARDDIRDYLIGTLKPDTVFKEKIDTLWKDTTITKEKQVPRYIEILRTDTFYKKDGSDTILKFENKKYKDTICIENDSIELQSFISGINSKLDSTKVKLKKSEIIKTNTITVTKYIEKPKKHFHITPQLGVGYGIFSKQPDAYFGFGISYEF